MGGRLSGGAGVSASGMVFRKRKLGHWNAVRSRRPVFRPGFGFPCRWLLRGQVCGECSLPSEWLSGQGDLFPRPVRFFGNGSGGKLIAVRGGWRGFRPGFGSPCRWASAGAGVRRVFRWNRNGCPARVICFRARCGSSATAAGAS